MRTQRIFSILASLPLLFLAACGGKEKDIEVISIAISQPSAEMMIGETLSLKATVSPSKASYDDITWTSTKPRVASVSESGLVTAISEGNATITVMAGGKTASCSVTVIKGFVAVSAIHLNTTALELIEGDTGIITVTVSPDDATDKAVTWTTTNEGIATVKNGVINAISPGEATISATAGDITSSCIVTVLKKVVAVTAINLNTTSIELVEGNSETIIATVSPYDATDKTVTWTTSNDGVATVQNGVINAVSPGEVVISATAGDITTSCIVTVLQKVVAVESITLNMTTLSLFVGESETLLATVKPKDATDKRVTWQSSNNSIVTVSDNGMVTAIKEGSVTITASAGDKTAACSITVKQRPYVSSLSINETSFNGVIGTNYAISVSISPSNAQYDLKWSSSDTRVAEVQGDGLSRIIYTKGFGVTDISVTDRISGKSASITVTTVVTDFEWKENTGITYSGYPLITIEEGDEYQLHYSCTPSNATHLFKDFSNLVFYEPTYIVDTPSVISINEDGLVTGRKVGTIGIKPTGNIVRKSSGVDRIYITVKAKIIHVNGIILNKSSLSLNVGESAQLSVTLTPENATNKTVTWTSSNNSVITVDSNGQIKAIAAGSATITASADGVSAQCSVSAIVPVSSITLNKTELRLAKGRNGTLIATVNPSDATYKTLVWTSDNVSVATVDQEGKVSAKSEGVSTITVATKDGLKKATCTVTVLPPVNTEAIEDDGGYIGWD